MARSFARIPRRAGRGDCRIVFDLAAGIRVTRGVPPIWTDSSPDRARRATLSGGDGGSWGGVGVTGARGRSRTDTLLRAADFESAASTNSATRALGRKYRGGGGGSIWVRPFAQVMH